MRTNDQEYVLAEMVTPAPAGRPRRFWVVRTLGLIVAFAAVTGGVIAALEKNDSDRSPAAYEALAVHDLAYLEGAEIGRAHV